jgi:hypothetical protein
MCARQKLLILLSLIDSSITVSVWKIAKANLANPSGGWTLKMIARIIMSVKVELVLIKIKLVAWITCKPNSLIYPRVYAENKES